MSKRWEDRSVLMGREMEAGKTDLQKQQITADTELSKKLIEAQNRPEKEMSPTDLYKMALGAFKAGTYPEWRNAQSHKYQMVLPENATKEDIETLVSNSQLAGGTLANKLEQSNVDLVSSKNGITKDQLDIRAKELGLTAQTLAAKLAAGEIEWRFPNEKQIEKGAVAPLLPAVQEKVDSLKADYRKDISPHIEMQDALDKLNATLPESGIIKGFNAVATINAFSKAIDPGAVVRDSDFKIASEATGKIDKVKAIINSYFDGNTISAEGVASLRQFINNYQNLVNQSMGRLSDFYGQKAEYIGGGVTRDMISVSPERTTFTLGTPRKK
jgi:hypothetical protein